MKYPVTDSQFAMWRTVIAFMHADGVSSDDERAFIDDRISRLDFSQEQKTRLLEDINTPQDPITLFEAITEARDRSHLIYLARLLCWSDGDFDQQEQKIHKLLHEKVLSKVDLNKAMRDVEKATADFQSRRLERKEEQTTLQKLIDAVTFWESTF